MKITTQTLYLTIALMLGFSQLALSNNNSLKITKQEALSDSTKLVSKNLQASVVQLNSSAKKPMSIFDQMSIGSNEVLEITLSTDLQNLVVNKYTDEYQLAFIEMKDATGKNVKHKLKVKPRGKYRRKICDFPPLKLNFSKEELLKQGLHPEFDKLKLVTHCTENKLDAKDNVLREYLSYQIYNHLTDNSFRTQLVKIKYIDLHNSSETITRYGFLIESKDEMAMRLNGQICDCHGLKPEMISKKPHNLMAMFQYMIGNEDWSSSMLRNVKAVQLYTGGMANNIVVPYDFDFSGLVNAPYAIPDPDLHHTQVTQRHFFGEFFTRTEFEAISNHFLSRKKEVLQTVRSMKQLSLNSRLEIDSYLKEFFSILNDEEQVKEIFFKQNSSISVLAR